MSRERGVAPVREISPSPHDRPRLVFFYEERGGASRRADGYLAQVLQRRQNHETFRILRVEVSERPDLLAKFRVDEIPTLLVIDENRVQARIPAPRGAAEIERALAPWLR